VTYTVSNQWQGGFGANLVVQNTGTSAWSSWTLTWTFPASGQAVSSGWNGTFSQSGQNVTVTNVSYNGSVPAGQAISAEPSFNGSWTGSNPVPTSFSVNGNVCGASSGGGSTPTPGVTPTSTLNNSMYAVNSGGTAVGTFAADEFYSGGSTYATTATIDTSAVSNPASQSIYQTERYGNFTYTFPNLTAGTQYAVLLLESENYWTGSGQRSFNVSINGQQVLSNFDIYAAAGGADKAIDEQFNATADGSGTITIQFTSVKDNAKVDGIEILGSSSATPPPTPTPGTTPTPTPTPTQGGCTSGGGNETLTSSQTGNFDGYYYSFWTEGSGSVSMNMGPCSYRDQWSGVGDFVGGIGWNPGSSHSVTYSASFNPSGDAYLALYGWSTSPLVEYYILDNWSGYNPASGATFMGSVTSDGSTYNLYEDQRVNQPSIIGTATFNQYWAIRQSPRTSGTITTSNIFNAWASHGMNLGTFNYQILATESFNGGSGNCSVTVSGL
jgi:endo-1,4-beta-xylanase